MQEAGRVWPVWVRSLGAMAEASAIVRFACPHCERVYDVDLDALIALRGRTWSLIDRRARCKASKCRASGAFVAALRPDQRFLWLHGRDMTPAFIRDSRPATTNRPKAAPCPPPRWGWTRSAGPMRTSGSASGWCGWRGGEDLEEVSEQRTFRSQQILASHKQAGNKSSLRWEQTMNAWEIERAVYDLEEVRIVIRAPWKTDLGDFNYQRAAPGTTSVTEWLQQRILPILKKSEVVVIDGNGAAPHGRTRMSTLRDSYIR